MLIILLPMLNFGFAQDAYDNQINVIDVTNNIMINTSFTNYCKRNNIELLYNYRICSVNIDDSEYFISEITTEGAKWGTTSISREVEGRLFITNNRKEIIYPVTIQ